MKKLSYFFTLLLMLQILTLIPVNDQVNAFTVEEVTEFYYDGNYLAQQGSHPQWYRRGERMSRQYLGYLVEPNQTINLRSEAAVDVAIEFRGYNSNSADANSITIAPNQVGSYTNNTSVNQVSFVRTPIYQVGHDSNLTFDVAVENPSNYHRIPMYNAKSMDELNQVENGYVIEFINDNGDVYSSATVEDNNIDYVVNSGVNNNGLDFEFNIKTFNYGSIDALDETTTSKNIYSKDGVLIELFQADIDNHIKFKDLNNNPLAFDSDRDSIGMRSRVRYEFDDGYDIVQGMAADIQDDSGNVIGNFVLIDDVLNVEINTSNTSYQVSVSDSTGTVLETANSTNSNITNYKLNHGDKIEFNVGLVEHIEERNSYLSNVDQKTKIYSRYNFNKTSFEIEYTSQFFNVSDPIEESFANQIVNNDTAFYLDLEGMDVYGAHMYGDKVADPFTHFSYYSIQDYGFFVESYFEVINQTTGLEVYTADVNHPEYFMEPDEDSSAYLYYLPNNHIASGRNAQHKYFQTHWGLMHEIGHGYQVGQNEMYDMEVSVNFAPFTTMVQYNMPNVEPGNARASSYEALIDNVINNGATYDSLGYTPKLEFFSNIINRFGSDMIAQTFGRYINNVVHSRNGMNTSNFYTLGLSETTQLNLAPYFELFDVHSNDVIRHQLHANDYAMPLSAMVDKTTAHNNYVELGLPYPDAIALKDEVDTLDITTDLTVNVSNNQVGETLYIYGSGYELMHETEITATTMNVNLPIGYYYVTTSYIDSKSMTEGEYVLLSTRTTNNNNVTIDVVDDIYSFQFAGRGTWYHLASMTVTGNTASWGTTSARPWINSSDVYLSMSIIRDGSNLYHYEVKGNENSVASSGSMTLEKGDIIRIYHVLPTSDRLKFHASVPNLDGSVHIVDYPVKVYSDFIFNGTYMVPATGDDVFVFDALEDHIDTVKDSYIPSYDAGGYYLDHKFVTNNQINQTITADTSLNGSKVYVYDESNTLVAEQIIKDEKTVFTLPRGHYTFASEYVREDGYVKDVEKALSITTAVEPIHLAVTNHIPTDVYLDVVANRTVGTFSYSDYVLNYKSYHSSDTSCPLTRCYSAREDVADVKVMRDGVQVYDFKLRASHTDNTETNFQLQDDDVIEFIFADTTPPTQSDDQGIFAKSTTTNDWYSAYYAPNTGTATYTITDGRLVPVRSLDLHDEDVLDTFNDDAVLTLPEYDLDGHHNDIKFFRNEFNTRNFLPPIFENAHNVVFDVYQDSEVEFGENIRAKDSLGSIIDYVINVTYENGQTKSFNSFAEIDTDLPGTHDVELHAVDADGNFVTVAGSFNVNVPRFLPTLVGAIDVEVDEDSQLQLGTNVKAVDYIGRNVDVMVVVEYADGSTSLRNVGDTITTTKVGTHKIIYRAIDIYGNETEQTVNLIVSEVANPTITNPGGETTNPGLVGTGSNYIYILIAIGVIALLLIIRLFFVIKNRRKRS